MKTQKAHLPFMLILMGFLAAYIYMLIELGQKQMNVYKFSHF